MTDTITLKDEETGATVTLPMPSATSILSPAGRAVLLAAEALLEQKIKEMGHD